MKAIVLALLSLGAAAEVAQSPVDYRFDEVKRKVVVTTSQKEVNAAKGQHAQGGDKVQTGWFSYALLSSDRYHAKFEIFSATDVQLAANTPGVILSLERGRLHAIFDKITGTEPRVVQTPGALLAVRGTQYDVEVGDDGKTTLKVWEGTVAVNSTLRPEPLLVHAGEAANYSRNVQPVSRPMTPSERSAAPPPGQPHGPGGVPANGNGNSPGQGNGKGDPGGIHGGPNQPPPGGHGPGPGATPPPPPPPGHH